MTANIFKQFAAPAESISAMSFTGRTPSWAEYASGAQCEQRAILARWNEIIATPFTTPAGGLEVARCIGMRNRTFGISGTALRQTDSEEYLEEMGSDRAEARQMNWNL
jgi:hypothetical protein